METYGKNTLQEDLLEITLNPFDYEEFKEDRVGYVSLHHPKVSNNLSEVQVLRKSTDARKIDIKILLRLKLFYGTEHPIKLHLPDFPQLNKQARKVHIVGFGPAGIFAAFKCLEFGLHPIVYERGQAVKERRRDVAKLNRDGIMNSESNYCFGEGGAGTFSDGKLYTRSQKRGRIQEILELFVLHGANEDILYEAHPHIGTNKLPGIIEQMRETILKNGGEVHFESKLTNIDIKNGEVHSLTINDCKVGCENVILATGHSARDIYYLLHDVGVRLEAKPFAMGFRIEHPQAMVDKIQYHDSKYTKVLPPASYSLVTQVKGKGIFSFCMCPGGIIAPAATSDGEVVVNGWSPSKRNGQFANSGWVTEIDKEEWRDFESYGSLAGLKFQESIEQKAFKMGGGQFKVPAQNLVDYISDKVTKQLNISSYHPGMTLAKLDDLYPPKVNYRLKEGLKVACKKMRGFAHPDAVLTAPESRTSSPVRIPRGADLQHREVAGLYPCGEGAGYAGGIVSAALDGIRVVKSIAEK